ncbi:multivesicular body subunit 12B-like [Limulus polyphemus]|uniref:Multivesicular body subunit 12B-like n=1 Tax=Limulus polyphemus TaxID=6850 RepID=A0ABM1BI11_LIMPO|nr:multivesicular body subunit 12B-like [Limulus polyphemus]XP_022250423.1 multivesicular body subunit 12B-like [Limulus polyphemus]
MDLQSVLKALPDDRPVTNICVVEDPTKCPLGFQVVSRTFDQDTDADLWKDRMFGKRITRYICFSKDKNSSDEVVESITVVGEREFPPECTVLLYTIDTQQKATRKKNLCYKLTKKEMVHELVTDIIVLSKLKKPPSGFTLAGELNSLLICYKCRPVSPTKIPGIISPQPYGVSCNSQQINPHYWRGNNEQSFVEGQQTFYRSTSTHVAALDGIPFTVNPKYTDISHLLQYTIPEITLKTEDQLLMQYNYSFQVEKQARQSLSSNFT